MSGGYRERWISVLQEWKHFVLLLVILGFLPYSVDYNGVSSPFILYLTGMFYDFQVLKLELVFNQTFSFISIINVALVIIPSMYFTFRYKNRIKDENIAILALITIALTLIVVSIVDSYALLSPGQIDSFQSPTPNLQFLPGFVFLLLFFAVIVPLLKEHATDMTRTSIQDYYRTGIRVWVSKKIPKASSGWLLACILTTPTLLSIEFTGYLYGTWSTNTSISFLGPYFTLFLRSGTGSGLGFLFILGGYEAWYNLLVFQLMSLLFSFSVVLYLQNKISRRLLVFSGLLSFVMPLFLSLVSFFSVILAVGHELIFPIPLLQILGILLIRRIDKLHTLSDLYAPTDYRKDIVTVPVGYILTSLIKRKKRGKNQENGEQFVTSESIDIQEATES